ncbi:MAG: YihY/virulence factor BrkB family protein [Anaerolineae bacterium]|nr:YihY/virulence factor BrkB family protein [Anaerolineae bacterium]
MIWLSRFWQFLKRVAGDLFDLIKTTLIAWRKDQASRLAAALAYYALFSIAPLLIILIAIIGLVYGERAAQDEIVYQLEGWVGRDVAMTVQTMITRVSNPASGIVASLVGVVTILFGASGLFNHVQGALNTIWHVPAPPGSGVVNFLKRRLNQFAMVFGVGALLLLSVFTDAVLAAIAKYFALGNPFNLRSSLISLGTVTLLFAVIYKVLPDLKIAWRDVIVGAAVTSLLFTAGKTLIGLYLGRSGVGSAYGAAGSLVALLVWIYYSAQIFLLGAEFTHVFAQKYGSLRFSKRFRDDEEDSFSVTPPPASVEALLEMPSELPPIAAAPTDLPPDVTSPAQPAARKTRFRGLMGIFALLGAMSASLLGWIWLHGRKQEAGGKMQKDAVSKMPEAGGERVQDDSD